MVPSSLPRLLRLAFCLLFIFAGRAHAANLTLYWNANSEPDIAGYRVHYGTASVPYGYTSEVGATTAIITNLKKGVTYTFAVTAFNTSGAESTYSTPISYTVGSSKVIPQAILANISSRTVVQMGENVLIGGFIVDGIVPKKVAVRALGPSLAAAGVTGAMADPTLQIVDSAAIVVASNESWSVPGEELSAIGLAPADGREADPQLELYDGNGSLINSNDNWRQQQGAAITATGLAPADDREAAIVSSLIPGAYSVVVRGVNGGTGVALFEVYALNQ